MRKIKEINKIGSLTLGLGFILSFQSTFRDHISRNARKKSHEEGRTTGLELKLCHGLKI